MSALDLSLPYLAIDTSTSVLSIAIYHDQHHYLYHQEVGTKQSDFILPAINDLLQESNINLPDLGAIIYSQGPGSFTGLRIGLGVAKGLALPFNIPLIPITSLDAVALMAKQDKKYILAATDARMNELFYAWYEHTTLKRISSYYVGKAQNIQIPEIVEQQQIQGIGNAFNLANINLPFELSSAIDMPTAKDYIQLASQYNHPSVTVEEAELLYVRNKIALTAKEQAEARAQS